MSEAVDRERRNPHLLKDGLCTIVGVREHGLYRPLLAKISTDLLEILNVYRAAVLYDCKHAMRDGIRVRLVMARNDDFSRRYIKAVKFAPDAKASHWPCLNCERGTMHKTGSAWECRDCHYRIEAPNA